MFSCFFFIYIYIYYNPEPRTLMFPYKDSAAAARETRAAAGFAIVLRRRIFNWCCGVIAESATVAFREKSKNNQIYLFNE